MDGREENLKKIEEMQKLSGIAAKINQGSRLTKEICVNYVGDNGTKYEGVVVVKRPNVGELIRIGVLKADMIQNQAEALGIKGRVDLNLIDTTIKLIATWVAELSVVVVQSSPWFANLNEIEDLGLLEHVYRRYTDWLDSFRGGSKFGFEEDSKTAQTEDAQVDTETL